MRNLKRVLSLALALVMVLGMMVITTSAADFTDADEITNVEAVEVLAELGIVAGSNGAFNPNGTFTREAAAKLITYMKIGPKMAEKLAGTDVFSDVAASRWSAKYIGYCANLGYIGGNGDGTFNPTGVLTDIALGKLVLCALGYDAAKYTGANWATAVTVDMIDAGLVDSVTGTAISREDACAMILAGMKKGTDVTTYNVTVGTDTVKFDNQNDALLYCAINDSAKFVGKVTVTTDSLLAKVYGVTCSTGTDDYGRPATTYTDGKKVDLAYADEAFATYTNSFTKKVVEDLQKEGYTFADNIIYNGGDAGLKLSDLYVPKTGAAVNGYTVELYATKKSIDTIVVTEGYMATVGKFTEAKGETPASVEITVSEAAGEKKLTFTDDPKKADTYDAIAAYSEKDVIIVYCAPGWAGILDIEPASSVAGKITKVIAGDYNCTTKIVIDGTTYGLNNECVGGKSLKAGTEGTLYLDAQGNGIGWANKKDADPDAKYAYVLDAAKDTVKEDVFSTGKDVWFAKLLYTDGTVETVEVTADATAKKGTIVTYAEGKKENEGKIVLTNAAAGYDGTFSIKKNTVVQSGIGGVMNNKTVLVVETLDKDNKPVYTVYTGVTNIPNLTAKRVAGIQDKGAWAVYYAMGAELTTAGPATTKDVVYLGSASGKIEEVVGDKVISYYTYNAIVNGEITTIDAAVNTLGGLYGELTLDNDGLVTEGKALTGDKIAVVSSQEASNAAKDGVINSYIYDDATVVYEVAKNGAITVSSIDAIEKGDTIEGYTTNGILTMVVVK